MTAYKLTKPCANCPFRTDIKAFLRGTRAEDIAEGLLHNKEFHCHKTIDYSEEEPKETQQTQHCAGALIILEKMEKPHQMMRIMERVDLYDHKKLDMEAPVYEDLEEWIEANYWENGG